MEGEKDVHSNPNNGTDRGRKTSVFAVPAPLQAVGLVPKRRISEPALTTDNVSQPEPVNSPDSVSGNPPVEMRVTESFDSMRYISMVNFNFRWDISGQGLNQTVPIRAALMDFELCWQLDIHLARELDLVLGVTLISMKPRGLNVKAKCFYVVDENRESILGEPVFNMEYTDVNSAQRLPIHSSVTLRRLKSLNEKLDSNVVQMSIVVQRKPSEIEWRNKLAKDLRSLIRSEEYYDVVFNVRGVLFNLHKVVLAGRCPGFRDLLMQRSNNVSRSIEMLDEDPEIFEEMVKFIYCGEVDDLPKNAKRLLEAAKRWDFDDLKSLCEEHLSIEEPSDPIDPVELPRYEFRFFNRNRRDDPPYSSST